MTDTYNTASTGAGQVIHTISKADLPEELREMDGAPQQLYVRAANDNVFQNLMQHRRVAIVGSRGATLYGEMMTRKFASELAAHGIVIVSGLAIGIDGVAHRAALEVGGLTMAVLPSSVSEIHPKTHIELARRIIENNGALVSEYPPGTMPFKTNFVARNRIVSGIVDALLITEASKESGTMHTASFAADQGVTVMAVPGNINSPTSVGTNNLIKDSAIPVTSTNDILFALGIEPRTQQVTRAKGKNPEEQMILDLLEQGVYLGSKLLEKTGLTIEKFNHHLTMLELTAKIRPLGANQWGLR